MVCGLSGDAMTAGGSFGGTIGGDVMKCLSRKSFLMAGATGVAALGAAQGGGSRVSEAAEGASPNVDEYGGFKMGSQSYCFREFSLDETIVKLKELGLNALEPYPGHFDFKSSPETVAEIKNKLAKAGVVVPAYGVVNFNGNAESNRRIFEFAKTVGITSLSANPTRDSFESLNKLVAEFEIAIAIHNHGPGSRYSTLKHFLRAVDGRHQLIGACIDTGHFIRSKEDPAEVIRKLKGRVHGVHLKDVDDKGENVIFGKGLMDFPDVFNALKEVNYKGYCMLEYEADPDDPVPAMKACLAYCRKLFKNA